MFSSFGKNSYKLSLLGIAIILLLGGCIFTNAKLDKPIHQPISIEDMVGIKQWGNSIPNGEERIETDEGTTKIVHWFNAISDIRKNKNFEGSTPEAGIIIEMKSGERILILRSGDQFEIQREGISYWGKQREMNILLEKLAGKPPEKQPQPQTPIKTEIFEDIETQKESEVVVAPIRPKKKTDVIQIEGTDQEFSFYLYKSLGFSTYIPEDMVVEAEHHSINIFPNYAGEINRNAILKIFARNTDTVEKMASLIEDDLSSKGFSVKPSQDNIFSFSEQEFDIESPLYGGASVFKHNEIIYGLIFYYTGEMGDGFHPRVMKIIDEIVWDDGATNEDSN